MNKAFLFLLMAVAIYAYFTWDRKPKKDESATESGPDELGKPVSGGPAAPPAPISIVPSAPTIRPQITQGNIYVAPSISASASPAPSVSVAQAGTTITPYTVKPIVGTINKTSFTAFKTI